MEDDAVAWIFGQAVLEVPQDLFIPSDALKVVLSDFEGPLDLLLYLIRKQNIDILNIPMVEITAQYLHYIAQIDKQNIDLVAEYLLMAGMLIEIKSRLLLPQSAQSENLVEETDPRAQLVHRLLVYEQMKLAGMRLDDLPRAGRDFIWAHLPIDWEQSVRLPDVWVNDLSQAWLAILSRAKNIKNHVVTEDVVSVRECMSGILRQLQQKKRCAFSHLFAVDKGVSFVVVSFIALLELIKEGMIGVVQEDSFGEIELLLAGNDNELRA